MSQNNQEVQIDQKSLLQAKIPQTTWKLLTVGDPCGEKKFQILLILAWVGSELGTEPGSELC